MNKVNKTKLWFFLSSIQVYATSTWRDISHLLVIICYKNTKKLLLGYYFFFIMCLRMISLGTSIVVCVEQWDVNII